MKKSDAIEFLPKKDLFRIDEVAEFFGVHPKTPYKWVEQWKDLGQAEMYVILPSGRLRIPRRTILIMINHTTLSSESTI